MMKPDLKVSIAWGTRTQLELALKLKKKYDEPHKHGYPVNARLTYGCGDGMPVSQRVIEFFSDFDYAIFYLE